jgi:hypothetical protein
MGIGRLRPFVFLGLIQPKNQRLECVEDGPSDAKVGTVMAKDLVGG